MGRGRWTGYALVLAAAACWASGGVAARWLFTGGGVSIDPLSLSAARAVTSAAVLGLVLLARDRRSLAVRRTDLPFLVAFGVAGQALLHYTYYMAIAHAGVAAAILLEYMAPVLVLVVAVAFMGERLTWNLPAGVVLAITGCALVVGVASRGVSVPGAGVAWGLAAAVFFAAYILMGKAASGRMPARTLMFWGLAFASAFWLVAAGPARVADVLLAPEKLAWVAYVAVVSTVLPFGLFLAGLRYIGSTQAAVTSTVEPVIAGVAAWLLLGENLDFWQAVGALLVVVAIAIVQRPAADGLPPAA